MDVESDGTSVCADAGSDSDDDTRVVIKCKGPLNSEEHEVVTVDEDASIG